VDLVVRPDFRKSLSILRDEWIDCTKCPLGVRRAEVGGAFVFGEGAPRGIMFIGEGPGVEEEKEGLPFIGKSGQRLRHLINKLGLAKSVYITNVVTCRSCGQAYDGEGNPRMKTNRHTGEQFPDIRDQPPLPSQMQACLPRLYEEIYLVDPVLIVALGGPSAEVLSGKPAKVLANSGVVSTISIPGAGYHANVTAKRRTWTRKVRGVEIMPVDQNVVNYSMMTLVHPAYVLRKRKDERVGNPMQVFVAGLKKAADIYEKWLLQVYGDTALQTGDITEDDFIEADEDDE
jgi:uracil-DNA glycosylase